MRKSVHISDVTFPSGQDEAGQFLADIILNNGYVPDSDQRVKWDSFIPVLLGQDLTSLPDISPLLSTALEVILTEPVPPISIIPSLFNEIQAPGLNTQILVGALGSNALASDVPEGGDYPEVDFTFGGGMQVARVGKCGIQTSFTEEALRYVSWDLIGQHLRIMRDALYRHKANKCVSFLLALGTTLYDNINPTDSLYGVLKGRGIDGEANGSLDAESLFKAIAHTHMEGYLVDTIVCSPMHFMMWLQDPVMQNILMSTGQGSYFNTYSGNPGPLAPFSNGSIGKLGPTLGNRINPANSPSGLTATSVTGRAHGMTATFNLPGYMPWPLRIVADPAVPFDEEAEVGDLILVSSGNVGAIMMDETLTQIEWADVGKEKRFMRLRERYALGLFNEGQGVSLIKNVPVARNYFPGIVSFNSPQTFEEISPTATITL